MKFGIARIGIAGLAFEDSADEVVTKFCSQKRVQRDSLCWSHYREIFNESQQRASLGLIPCPYGFFTTSSIGGPSAPIALTGFKAKDATVSNAFDETIGTPDTGAIDINKILSIIDEVSSKIRQEELGHFEAALHDTRHLNHAISQNAERLLSNSGWEPDANWDLAAIQNDEIARRALTIFAASRDLSQAIQMHEISRDPEQAARDISPIPIHKLFYRQVKISADRSEKSGVRCNLGNTLRTLRLSAAFRLIPKIILDNAFKYASRGSELRVIFIETSMFFVIECKNSGPAVKDSEIQGLFKRGSRGSNKAGINGQGIGLWLAKTIVEANSGHIEFSVRESGSDYAGRRLGETIVTIKLPRKLLS